MSEALVPVVDRREIARPGAAAVVLPEVIVDAGPAAVERFLEFFAAAIANDRTRAAYGQAVGQFLGWCGARGLGLRAIAPLHVAAYIRTHPGSVPTVKQHLAAIRAICDWLVVHQVLPVNPAAAVRGPKHVVTKGATPVLTPAEARALLDRIDTGTRVGLRDRALLSVMVYSFARVSAAVGMRRQDYFRQGTRGWLRLHEKGGKRHDVPAHHRAEEAVEAYLDAGGVEDAKAPLFQSVDRAGGLSGRPLGRRVVLAMIKRRAAAAGLPASTCCHTFRATGITAYLSNGGTLEYPVAAASIREGLAETLTVLRLRLTWADRPQRTGGLQRVAALNPSPTLRAVADVDVDAAHEGTHHREVFLVQRRHPGHLDRAAAVRTRGRCRRRVVLVDLRRARTARLPPVGRALGVGPWRRGLLAGIGLGARLQPAVLTPQALGAALQAFVLVAQARAVALARVRSRRRRFSSERGIHS